MGRSKKSVGIRGAYGERNFGDDALMYFLYSWSSKNRIDGVFIGNKANYIYKILPKGTYILKERFHRYYFKTLIYGGGTQFFSFENVLRPQSKLKLLFTSPIELFRKIIFAIDKRISVRTPNFNFLYSVGVGLGPFIKNSNIEFFAQNQIKKMQGVFVRDQFSYEFAKPHNENTFLYTDICFLPEIFDFNPYLNKSKEINKIGIILRDWSFSSDGAAYLNRIVEEAFKLDKQYEVEFILFKNELKCEEVIRDLGFKVNKWNPDSQSIEGFINFLSGFDLFISSRFHGVIFGALMNIPSIAIEIEPKLNVTKELLEDGVSIWEQPFNEGLVPLVKGIDYELAKNSLTKAVKKHNKLASQMFVDLLSLIKKSE